MVLAGTPVTERVPTVQSPRRLISVQTSDALDFYDIAVSSSGVFAKENPDFLAA